MENPRGAALVMLVDKAVSSLEALGGALDDAKNSSDVHSKVKEVEEDAKQLHSAIEAISSQRVVVLASDQLMEAGIVLYNASRATFKSFQRTTKDDAGEGACAGARFPILFVRFMAARVMGLALACSTSGHEDSAANNRHQSVVIDDCLDVLRSYGRVGSLLLETAAADTEKCFEYLMLSSDALDNANVIWGRVGLACLTRFKGAVELEEILQDLWDFSVDRIRAIRLLQAFNSDNSAANTIIETLHELQMLLPYMLGNGKALLELIQALLDEWGRREQHADRVVLAEEALRLCDAMDSAHNEMEDDSTIPPFKRGFLTCLLDSVSAVGDVAKAEACFALLGSLKEPSAHITMLKLYLRQQQNDKATAVLKLLFQRDDVVSAIVGVRLFVEANDLSDDSLNLYRQLERHYGDHVLEIGLDLACCLAASEFQHHRVQAIRELRRLGGIIATSPSPVVDISVRIQQTVYDAAEVALSAARSEECAMWAELGVDLALTSQESASFKRLIAASMLKAGRVAESLKWAQEALRTDPSKASLFSMFEASLAMADADSVAVQEIIHHVKERQDFKPHDLIAYGYAAHSSGQDNTCLFIMDELCCLFVESDSKVDGLPLGLLLQNTAQLALACTTASKPAGDESPATTSFANSLLKYADLFLKSAEFVTSTNFEEFAPQAAFVWFYATSFNVARSCNDGALYVRAADFAVLASRVFGEDCSISGRELECLIAALSTEMASFESCDRTHLEDLLAIIDRANNTPSHRTSSQTDFVTKCELAVRLRLYDPDIDALRSLCHENTFRDADNCIELGELILHAAHYDEANGVRKSYRALASELFKLSLQLVLQGDAVPEDKLSYIFRRLITLAESRSAAFEWFEQLVQLAGSVDCKFPDLEAEWFISKAWNMGVQQHRCQSFDEAQQFMKIALTLQTSIGPSLKELATDLHQQYQRIRELETNAITAS